MRVRNPVKLAELLLAEDKGWDSAKVKALVDDGPENNKIPLDHKIPVHITYFTAVIGDDGKPQYFKDVYGHENRIVLATEGRWKEIVKTPNHLSPIVSPKGSREEVAELSSPETQADVGLRRCRWVRPPRLLPAGGTPWTASILRVEVRPDPVATAPAELLRQDLRAVLRIGKTSVCGASDGRGRRGRRALFRNQASIFSLLSRSFPIFGRKNAAAEPFHAPIRNLRFVNGCRVNPIELNLPLTIPLPAQ